MLREEIVAVVRDSVSKACYIPTPELDDTTNLFMLGLDSLSVIELVARLRFSLEIDFSWRDFYTAPNVNGIVDMIETKQAKFR